VSIVALRGVWWKKVDRGEKLWLGVAGRESDDARSGWRLEQDVDVRPGQVVRLELMEAGGLVVR